MSQQLVVGKYKFYPYERESERAVTLDDLEKLIKKSRARIARDGKTGPRSKSRRTKV